MTPSSQCPGMHAGYHTEGGCRCRLTMLAYGLSRAPVSTATGPSSSISEPSTTGQGGGAGVPTRILKRGDAAPRDLAPGLAVGKAQCLQAPESARFLLLTLECCAARTERLDPQRGRTYRQCFVELGAAP
jgi:hypothetical protein